MGTRTGHATADLLALLRQFCPQVAEEMRAAESAAPIEAGPQAAGADVAGEDTGAAGADQQRLRWERLTPGEIPGLNEFASTASAPIQTVASLLQFVRGILEVVSGLLLTIPDPIKALVLAAYTLLKEIIDDLLGSGCYLYVDAPGVSSNLATLSDMGLEAPELPNWMAGGRIAEPRGQADGFQRWAFRFEQSFDDPGDENRPIFSDGAPVEAMFVVATAPQLVDLRLVLNVIAKLLDIQSFEKAWERFVEDAPDPDRARLRSTSVAPDWRAWRLRDIGPPEYPLRNLERVPELIKTLLLNVDDIVQLIKDLVAAVKEKIDLLTELVEIIQSVIELIRAISATGLHALVVVTDEGVAGLKKAFLEAENRPNTDAQGNVMSAHAIAGVCFLTGTTNALPIWALLGEGQSFEEAYQGLHDDWKQLEAQAEEALEDTKAIAAEAWEGAQEGEGSPRDLGFKGLWGEFSESFDEQKDAMLRTVGLSREEADEWARNRRNELISWMEQVLPEGMRLDPHVVAHIEATRRARRRGRRSLAAGFGSRSRAARSRGGGAPG